VSGPIALASLVLFAAAFRWLQWTRAVTLFNDGPLFLGVARSIDAGDWAAAFGQPHHLLYPALVALVHWLGLGWENAAAAVSVAGGSAAVAFAFLLLRDAFSAPVAWLGGALLAVHSRAVEHASDVQTDGLYTGCFLAGVWMLWRAWTSGSLRWASAAGVAAGLAYLTRPEGIGIVVVAVALAGLGWLRGSATPAQALRWAASCAVAAALVAAPYTIEMQRRTGAWSLTQKKSVRELVGAPDPAPVTPPAPTRGPAAPPPVPPGGVEGRLDRGEDGLAVVRADSAPERAAAAARMLLRTSRSSLRYGVVVLIAAGLVASRGRPSRRGLFLLTLIGVYGAVLFALTFAEGYVSRRHALPPLIPLFGYAAVGAMAVAALLARAAPQPERVTRALAAGLVAGVAVAEVWTQREPRREEERAARAAAEWLHANAEPGTLLADRMRLGYYAGMPYIGLERLDRVDAGSLRSLLDQPGVRYILLDEPEDVERLRQVAGDRVRPLHHAIAGGREAWVFERVGSATP
jgi:hypothetical protein